MATRGEKNRSKNYRLPQSLLDRMLDFRELFQTARGIMPTETQVVEMALREYFDKWRPELADRADQLDKLEPLNRAWAARQKVKGK
jgi:hypothetical protein